MTTDGMRLKGVECPECGSLYTSVMKAGFDSEATRLRRRNCKTCGFNFNTIEIPMDYDFEATDTMREPDRVRVARRSKDYFVLTHTQRREGRSDGTSVTAHLKLGKASNFCYSGRHRLVGKNVYLRPNGRKNCRACMKEHQDIYQEIHKDRIRANRRARHLRRKNDNIVSRRTSSQANHAGDSAIEVG